MDYLGLQQEKMGIPGQLANAVPRPSTVTESLEARKMHIEAQLERVNAALAALKKNPEIETALNLIQQASY